MPSTADRMFRFDPQAQEPELMVETIVPGREHCLQKAQPAHASWRP
jgi:hypothetical protein